MKKLKEWYFDNAGYERERDVIGTLAEWYKANLVITDGSGHTVEEIFGLPYTSSSDYAAVWNCQAEAYYKANPSWWFEGCAITEDSHIVAVFSERDAEGNEIGWHDVVMA